MESLKLKQNQRFLERWFKASCTGFTEFERNLVALALENKRDKNCVFLDSGLAILWSYHTILPLESVYFKGNLLVLID